MYIPNSTGTTALAIVPPKYICIAWILLRRIAERPIKATGKLTQYQNSHFNGYQKNKVNILQPVLDIYQIRI